ncbi:hypothetical protein LOTGIDRAFT_205101 [Lottia gigantea]|uniref:Uncharacterized protein n=1 Tax=Lottia gigantea TaxID=225164 RepID=V4B9X7_LOTGI|nr:hypothetical protein LOTGIDRAFT_205101 [Lottia gigantea]ESP02367.1 hypothetical protein LOTGIDRAFT_205101 [Lottia gigantea]
MNNWASLGLALLLGSWTLETHGGSLKLLGSFKVPHAGFTEVVEDHHSNNPKDKFHLFISSFNPIPLTTDYVYEVAHIGSHLGNVAGIKPKVATTTVTWPNEVNEVPESVFHKNMLTVSGGFLVPLKTHGMIELLDYSSEPPKGPYRITDEATDSKWFYHRVMWLDMNGDGRLDAVTCRAEKPVVFGGPKGQLIWFENPGGSNALKHTWKSHVLDNGADVYFDIVKLPTPQGKKDCIITAGFFSKSLNIYWTTDSKGRWNDKSKVKRRVIDNHIKAVFDVKATDLDHDGKLDLLVTSNDAHDASMYIFEIPSDFRTGAFKKHVIATKFASRTGGVGKGAPGSPLVFYPQVKKTNVKPWILLSGDDDGRAHLLKPRSEAHGDFKYSMEDVLDVGSGTVGKIAAKDVDGDGYSEVFIPGYNQGLVHVYTTKV